MVKMVLLVHFANRIAGVCGFCKQNVEWKLQPDWYQITSLNTVISEHVH